MRRTKYPVVLQQDETDCGVACLLSVIRFYGGNHSLETLRRMSGTQTGGTSLLGLHQSAGELGFDATGTQLSMECLLQQETPCILHVLVDGHALHYVVFYGCTQRHGKTVFIIGDPAKGLCHLTEAALAEIWQSKIALLLTPNSAFQTVKAVQKVKWQWIRNFIREDMPTLSIAVALGIAIAILGITMAIFSQRLVDDILPRKDFSKFYISIAMVLVLLLIKEGLSVIRQFFLLRQSRDFNIRIADFFYNHLLRLPKPFFDSRKIGELTSRLNDTGRIQRVISQLAGSAIIDSLEALFSIGFLFSYSWEIGLSSLLFIPLFYLLIYWHNKQIIAGQQSVMTGYAFTEGNYISTLHGIDAIKNHHKEAVFAQSNKAIYQKYQDHLFSLGKVNIRLSWMANTVGVLFLIALLFFAGDQVLAGHMKSGQLVAVLGICTSLLPSIAHLAMVSIPLHEAKIAFDRMFDFTSMAVESKAAPDAISAFESLQVQALSFRFPGRQKLLQDISFEVKKGEMVALVGENGCGKSTILQILQKHYTAAAGNILVNEHCAFHLINLTAWRSLVSVVPQQVHIFNTTILENIAFEEAGTQTEKVLAFLHRHGFDKFFNRLPQSYATLVGEEGINLSGGQKQLIGLARALYQQPQLLLLDEATAAMDRDTEHFVLHLLDELKPSMGIIFITHRMHILKSFCQRIYILENGTITHRGHHNELLQAKNLYSAYWADLN